MHVLGRRDGATDADRPTGHLGRYRARDGGEGAPVGFDLDRPHATLVVGKRGAGKSHTLGVVAEAAARADGVAPVVVDPMGTFAGLARPADGAPVPATVRRRPRVRASAVPPASWPALVGLDPVSPVGALVWRSAAATETLAGMRAHAADADAAPGACRAAENHLRLAASWDAFDADGLAAADLLGGEVSVLDVSGLDAAPANAVCHAVATGLYDELVGDADAGDAGGAEGADGAGGERPPTRLPWLFVDEAHVFFDGVADAALRTLWTRGRHPGVSLVAATQRPAALPAVAVSQADQLVAHRLTAAADVEALAAARPTYLDGALAARLPAETGTALVVDDATESVHEVRVRPRASRRASGTDAYE